MAQRSLWPTPYGKIVSRKIFANLLKEVIKQNLCVACGTCVAACPANVLAMGEEFPKLVGACIRCGYCYGACPITIDEEFAGFNGEIDVEIFGERRKEIFGIYKNIYVFTDQYPEDIIKKILKYLLDEKIVDVVATYGYENYIFKEMLLMPRHPIIPGPIVITRSEDISKKIKPFILSPPTGLSLRGASDELYASHFQASYTPKICYLAPPPHIRAVWRMRLGASGNYKLEGGVRLMITIFNRQIYSLSRIKKILTDKGLDFNKLRNFKIDNNGIIFIFDGNMGPVEVLFTYDELEKAIHPSITKVRDRTGEYADISIGKIKNRVFIITRSEDGDKYIQGMIKRKILDLDKVDEKEIELIRGLYK